MVGLGASSSIIATAGAGQGARIMSDDRTLVIIRM